MSSNPQPVKSAESKHEESHLVLRDERLPDRVRSAPFLSPMGSSMGLKRPGPLKLNSHGYLPPGQPAFHSRSPVRSPIGSLATPVTPIVPLTPESPSIQENPKTPKSRTGSTSTTFQSLMFTSLLEEEKTDSNSSINDLHSPRPNDSNSVSPRSTRVIQIVSNSPHRKVSFGQLATASEIESLRSHGSAMTSTTLDGSLDSENDTGSISSQPSRTTSAPYAVKLKRKMSSLASLPEKSFSSPLLTDSSIRQDMKTLPCLSTSSSIPSTGPIADGKQLSLSNSGSSRETYRRMSQASATGNGRERRSSTHGQIQKKAVVIGISYVNNIGQETNWTHGRLAKEWYNLLVRRLEFISDEIWLLSDIYGGETGNSQTTSASSANITKAMDWLVEDVTSGDHLFMAFNGNIAFDIFANRKDPCNPPVHALVPADYPQGKLIWETDIDQMIQRVPHGVDLQLVFDGRRSWNLLRLPCIYLPLKKQRHRSFEIQELLTPSASQVPELSKRASMAMNALTKSGRQKESEELERHQQYYQERLRKYETTALVVCFGTSPIKYKKFPMPVVGITALDKGEYAEACIHSIAKLKRLDTPLTYRMLIDEMAERLSPPGFMSQVPQICATRELDLDRVIPL